LSDEGKAWLEELETGIYPLLKGQEVIGIATASTPSNGDFTLVEIGQHVCVKKQASSDLLGANGCAENSQVESGSGYIVTPGCGKDEVVGFMPNGISSLSTRTEDGAETSVIPVISNMYAVTLPSVNTVISGTTDDGKSISVTIPLDGFPSNCF
jgi:hypothetical protein